MAALQARPTSTVKFLRVEWFALACLTTREKYVCQGMIIYDTYESYLPSGGAFPSFHLLNSWAAVAPSTPVQRLFMRRSLKFFGRLYATINLSNGTFPRNLFSNNFWIVRACTPRGWYCQTNLRLSSSGCTVLVGRAGLVSTYLFWIWLPAPRKRACSFSVSCPLCTKRVKNFSTKTHIILRTWIESPVANEHTVDKTFHTARRMGWRGRNVQV